MNTTPCRGRTGASDATPGATGSAPRQGRYEAVTIIGVTGWNSTKDGIDMSWVDAVYDTVQDKDVRETVLAPGMRVHVDWAVVTNLSDREMTVAVWVNPRQRHVKVWDPTGKNGESIEANFTGDDTHLQRGSLSVDRLTQPG